MGTKVQCKSYLPEYFPMRNFCEDSNSSWSLYYDGKTMGAHLYNGLMLGPVNGYSEYDKEILKRTMLEHETVFRKQVYELHRLYRIQKGLMDELQKNELCIYSVPMDPSPPNSYSSRFPSEGTKNKWQMHHLPVADTGYNRQSVAYTDDMRPSLNFLKENRVQSGPVSTENGGLLKNGELLDTKIKSLPRRMFDLHLPADVYIDKEDIEITEKGNVDELSLRGTDPLNQNGGIEPENDVKLTLGTCEDPSFREANWKSNTNSQNGLSTHSLADLNEPINDVFCDEAAGSASSHFLRPTNHREEIQGRQSLMRSNSSFLGLHRDFFKDMHRDEGTCSNFLQADREEVRREWPPFNNETGENGSNLNSFSPGSCNGKFPMSSGLIQLKQNFNELPSLKFPSFFLHDQNKNEKWLREKPTHGIEISERDPHLADPNYSGLAASPMPDPFSVPRSDYACSTPSLISSWRKPVNSVSHIPIAVQALPCFRTMNMQSRSSNIAIPNRSNVCDKWQYSGDLSSHPRFGSDASSYRNGFHHGFPPDSNSASHLHLPSITPGKQNFNVNGDYSAYENSEGYRPQKYFKGLQCTYMKPAMDVNLNQALSNVVQDGITTQQDIVICDVEGRHEELAGGISWLGTKPACSESVSFRNCASQLDLGSSQVYSQPISSCSVVAQEFERKQGMEKGPSLHVLQVNERRLQMNSESDNLSNTRILGFPIIDKIQQSAIPSPFLSPPEQSLTDETKCSRKDGLNHTDLSRDTMVPSLEKQIPVGGMVAEEGVGNSKTGFRNYINLNFAATSMDSLKSSEISPEDEQCDAAKIASAIDLESPIASQAENVLSQGDFLGMDHFVVPVQKPLSETDGSQETECLHETLVRVAAESIVAMSMDNTTFHLSSPRPRDSLHWFAEVVSNNAESASVLKVVGDGDSESSDDEGVDLFESMTLKLQEIKEDEYQCRPPERENQKEEETGTASLLLTRPRRGQARRRQRRDFQKDILPGLASLSRHEVTEDLQAFGGLMRASGRCWQTGFTRRNTGRNGFHGQARGRRRPRSLAVAVEENHVSPPTTTNTEPEIDGMSIIGWGRTTRRCRRQRCASGNVSAALT